MCDWEQNVSQFIDLELLKDLKPSKIFCIYNDIVLLWSVYERL